MEGLTVENTNDKLVLSINKENFSESVLLEIMKVARIEFLIEKAKFAENITAIGNDIKANWWNENKTQYLNK